MNQLVIKDFNLKHTLECGQFFRYKKLEDDSYLVNYKDILFIIRQEKDIISFSDDVDKNFIKQFFRLDDNLEEIYKIISTDDFLKDSIEEYKGLRLIRQDPWECLISYICSSASNIPKIRMNIENLSQFFGTPISCNIHNSFSFPKINSIDDFDKIKLAKTGFRAKYIEKVNKLVNNSYFENLKNLSYSDAKKELVLLPGVGDKIADCVLLFSLDHLDAFPADTWIIQAMAKIYGLEKASYKSIREFAIKRWGEYAGYAQQYIYMKIREDNINGKN